jgi:4,5-dihydroxyphthalate decarboxylase
LPWINAKYEETSKIMGKDFWPYGVAENYKALSTMARYSYEQGLAIRLLTVEEMFAEGNVRETKV